MGRVTIKSQIANAKPAPGQDWSVEFALDTLRLGDSGEFWDDWMQGPQEEAEAWLMELERRFRFVVEDEY